MGSKSKKSEQESDAVALEAMDIEEQIPLKQATKKTKKRKNVDEKEAEAQHGKRHKKSKKDVEPAVAEDREKNNSKNSKKDIEGDNLDNDKAARKEKKRLKKEKKERKAAAALRNVEDSKAKEAEAEKAKGMGSKARQIKSAAQPVASADQWNPDALTGDAARKNKFLRLLGAGKGVGIEVAPKKQQASDKDIQKVESELERQFAAGIRMKHGGMGKRTGLGM